jgi:hypothetical protein
MKVVKSKKDQNKLPFAFCQLTQSFERMQFHCLNGKWTSDQISQLQNTSSKLFWSI